MFSISLPSLTMPVEDVKCVDDHDETVIVGKSMSNAKRGNHRCVIWNTHLLPDEVTPQLLVGWHTTS